MCVERANFAESTIDQKRAIHTESTQKDGANHYNKENQIT